MTGQIQDELVELMDILKRQSEKLSVPMHLGKAEAKDLWKETED